MPAPSEHKTVQTRILKYAEQIGWTCVPRAKAGRRRGFDADGTTQRDRARKALLFFGDLLHQLMTAQLRVRHLDLSGIRNEPPANAP